MMLTKVPVRGCVESRSCYFARKVAFYPQKGRDKFHHDSRSTNDYKGRRIMIFRFTVNGWARKMGSTMRIKLVRTIFLRKVRQVRTNGAARAFRNSAKFQLSAIRCRLSSRRKVK